MLFCTWLFSCAVYVRPETLPVVTPSIWRVWTSRGTANVSYTIAASLAVLPLLCIVPKRNTGVSFSQSVNILIILFYFFHPICYLRPSFFLSPSYSLYSLIVVTQIRRSGVTYYIAGSSPPSHYASWLAFLYREKIFQLFLPSSTCVELCLPYYHWYVIIGALSS